MLKWIWHCLCVCRPSDPLTHVVVSSNFLVMAMNNNLLLRLDLEHPDQQEGGWIYDFIRKGEGCHLIWSPYM